jgi:serine/threonine protein kinase
MNERVLKRGKKLGDYTIERKLGKGGKGNVYLAHGPGEISYALKVTDASNGPQRTRLWTEFETLSRLRHPAIVSVVEWGEEQGCAYYVMDFIDGAPLRDFVASGHFFLPLAVELFWQVLEAVAYMHDRGVTHRDLTPSNIIVDSGGHPVIVGFGIARSPLHPDLTSKAGTLDYVSPEQAAFLLGLTTQRPDPKPTDDVYALGVTLYYVLCGSWPVPHVEDKPEGPSEFLHRVLHHTPQNPWEVNSHTPPGLASLALKMLSPSVEVRPATARLALEGFAAVMGKEHRAVSSAARLMEVAGAARKEELPELTQEQKPALSGSSPQDNAPPRRHSSALVVVVAMLVLVGIFFAGRLTTQPPSRPTATASSVHQDPVFSPAVAPEHELSVDASYPDLLVPELFGALPVIKGPVPSQVLPPCPPGTVALRGGCWIQYAIEQEADEEEVRAICNGSPGAYVLSLDDCLKNRRLFHPRPVKPAPNTVQPGAEQPESGKKPPGSTGDTSGTPPDHPETPKP